MSKVSDLEAMLLSGAARRESGSLLPLSESTAATGHRAGKAMTALLKRGLAEERETGDPVAVHRTDGDLTFGVFITAAGSAAIGVEGTVSDAGSEQPIPAVMDQPNAPRITKSVMVIALLQREAGATMPELIAATGWLPHTTRAALTGLRKKGHTVARGKRGDATCYHITTVAA